VTSFKQDGITLHCGDNVETMQQMEAGSIDLVVTSPPYDNLRTYGGHSWDFEAVAQQLWRLIKPGGVVVWIVNDATIDGSETGTSFRQALRFMEIGFRLHDTMIWDKNGCPFPETTRYYPCFEFMFVMAKGKPKAVHLIEDRRNANAGQENTQTQRQRDGTLRLCSAASKGTPNVIKDVGVRWNIWRASVGFGKVSEDVAAHNHPAIFPESLARDHILSWSNEGDTVLDPFSGSGTTIKMARLMGRRGVGIEINPEYCAIAVERLRQRVLF
jgi:DNA modification methylase